MSTLDVRTPPSRSAGPTALRRPIRPMLPALLVSLVASGALGGCGLRDDDPAARVQLAPVATVEPEAPRPPPTWAGREEVVDDLAQQVAEGRIAIDLDTLPESCIALLGAVRLVAEEGWQRAVVQGGEAASLAREMLDDRLSLVPPELHDEIGSHADEYVALFATYAESMEAAGGSDAPDELHREASREYLELTETVRAGMPDLMPRTTAWSNRRCFAAR
jgi:hypothetical protein